MSDITKNEVQDDGKKKALGLIKSALELAGLNPDDYDLSLRKANKIKPPPNIQLFQTAAYLAATCLSPSANKVLMFFLSISSFENYVGVDQNTIANEINMSRSSVEKGIKELTDNGVIIKTLHPSDHRRKDYFINPMHAWKGKMLNRKIKLSDLHQQDPDQLHLFGETLEENQEREANEIVKKRQNLFLTGGKSGR